MFVEHQSKALFSTRDWFVGLGFAPANAVAHPVRNPIIEYWQFVATTLLFTAFLVMWRVKEWQPLQLFVTRFYCVVAAFDLRADVLNTTQTHQTASMKPVPDTAEVITLGAGCFWCTEAVFRQIPGVLSVTPGYIGGHIKNPTYEMVCSGDTGHAEVARVVYDPKQTTLEKILEIFWEIHDPTSRNRQGADAGTQYRSAIFYHTDAQKAVAEKSKVEAAKEFTKPIVTEITRAGEFYPAEDYHQDYYRLNKNRNPYCRIVIAPKLRKLHLKE